MNNSGKYKIIQTVASGGTAVLYKAVQTSLDRVVAIKRLHQHLTDDENFTRRFILEAKAAASLDHENIVSVIDFGQEENAYQMVMEFVEGESLKDVLERWRPINHELALALVHQVCLGLEHAHQKGIVHRDIKPGNLMLTAQGRVKIADFGLAKLTQSNTSQTAANSILGTPLYMSPEQAFGESVDQRSDLFSLGTVLYELLTGRQPFSSENYMGVIQNIINKDIPKIRQLNPEIPAEVEGIVCTALSKAREERFQSARHFREAIEDYLGIVRLRALGDSLGTLLEPTTGTRVLSNPNIERKPMKKSSSKSGAFAIFIFALLAVGTATIVLNPPMLERVRLILGISAEPNGPGGAQTADIMVPSAFDLDALVSERVDTVIKQVPAPSRVTTIVDTTRRTVVFVTDTVRLQPPPVVEKKKPAPDPTPAIRRGFLEMKSTPAAEVYVDGVYKGDTPIKLKITTGAHEVECRHPQYETYRERINIANNELSRRSPALVKLKGSVQLSTVDGAELYVDGKYVARTPLLNPLQLDAGPHMLLIKKEGHLTWSSEVVVEAKKTLPLRITLSPSY